MPEFLSRVWRQWKKIGQAIGDFIARLVLSLFYFTIFVPFGLGVRFFGDPLNMKKAGSASWWLERKTRDLSLDDARRQW
jgi:hypothetical protein